MDPDVESVVAFPGSLELESNAIYIYMSFPFYTQLIDWFHDLLCILQYITETGSLREH